MSADVWVTVRRDVNWDVARHRHLIARGYKQRDYATTACGATGGPGDVWQSNHSKPMCPRCVAAGGGA
jgi:hypothetical protein